MTKLEQILPALYRDMHASGVFLGDTWRHHVPRFLQFVGKHTVRENSPVLDFGCGPNGGLAAGFEAGLVIPYDPYVKKYAEAEPWKSNAKTLFSCDVMEHMTIGQLRWFVRRVCKMTSLQKIFLALSTRSANKVMPNGLNAHLTVRSPDWWHGFFEAQLDVHYECVASEAQLHTAECVFMFVRRPTEATPCVSPTSPPSAPTPIEPSISSAPEPPSAVSISDSSPTSESLD